MTLNRERERFDNPIVLFNNQSLSMSKNSSNNILPLKFSPDEICRPIDLNSTMGVNFSDKGDLSFCNRDIKIPIGVNISFKGKTLWQMHEDQLKYLIKTDFFVIKLYCKGSLLAPPISLMA